MGGAHNKLAHASLNRYTAVNTLHKVPAVLSRSGKLCPARLANYCEGQAPASWRIQGSTAAAAVHGLSCSHGTGPRAACVKLRRGGAAACRSRRVHHAMHGCS